MRNTRYRKYLYILLFIIAALLVVAFVMSKAATEETMRQNKKHKSNREPVQQSSADIETAYLKEKNADTDTYYVCPCGYPIGIYVKTEGVMVINTGSFRCIDNTVQSPCEGILQQGDYIISINGTKLKDKKDLMEIVANCQGSPLDVYIMRDGEKINVRLLPKQNEDGNYMLGLWIKDDISGIGTLTYIDENGFAALGHSINDNDTGEMFVISDGAIYEAQLLRIVKSDGEHAG